MQYVHDKEKLPLQDGVIMLFLLDEERQYLVCIFIWWWHVISRREWKLWTCITACAEYTVLAVKVDEIALHSLIDWEPLQGRLISEWRIILLEKKAMTIRINLAGKFAAWLWQFHIEFIFVMACGSVSCICVMCTSNK